MTYVHLLDSYDRAMGTESTASRLVEGRWASMLSARLPVTDLASGSVACLAAAVDRFCRARGLPTRAWELDPQRIAASFLSDRMMRIDGNPVRGFAPLSGFFESADGWVRTHANYPHHLRRLTTALDLPQDVDPVSFAQRIRSSAGANIEQRCADESAVAVRVRSELEWAGGDGAGTAHGPLVGRRERSDRAHGCVSRPTSTDKPLRGVRVIDLTRVIAGPTATRALALLGADVLRIDSPRLPEIEWQHLDNGQGKRTALVDLETPRGRAVVERLLSQADVLVTGYRPGSVDQLLPDIPPGIVIGQVSAWGRGAWHERRGFDSIVQAATGIAVVEGSRERPGALPAQALDHATGHLLAAAVVDAVASTGPGSRGQDVTVSLADTAAWLLGAPGRTYSPSPPTLPPHATTTVTHGSVTTSRPALACYDDYDSPAHSWGTDEPAFARPTPGTG